MSYLNKTARGKTSVYLGDVVSPVRLETFDEGVHGNVDHVGLAVAAAGSLAELDPPRSGKVGALGSVESCFEGKRIIFTWLLKMMDPVKWLTAVKPRVVPERVGDHYFPGFLNNLVVRDGVLPEDARGDHTC